MPTLYVMIGMPASGKSHWRRQYLDATVISPDNVLEEKWGYDWSPVHVAQAWATCYEALGRAIVNEMFSADQDAEYVWDAGMTVPQDRSAVLGIAKGAGWRVIAVYVNTPYEVCVERNEERPRHRRVPLKTMKNRWMRLTPPQPGEKWDDTIYVEHGEDE